MRKPGLSFLLLLIVNSAILAQDTLLTVKYYFSTGDFIDDRLSQEEVRLEVKEIGHDFIYVRNILDPATMKKAKNGSKAWAIAHEGNAYVNLVYSNNSKAPDMFIRIDIKGRFCLAVMDLDFLNSLGEAVNTTTAGLPQYIVDPKDAGGVRFQDRDGNMKKIFIVDTKDLSIVLPYKANNAPAEHLTESTLKWLVGKENFKGSLKEYTVEEIIAIVEDLNQRQ